MPAKLDRKGNGVEISGLDAVNAQLRKLAGKQGKKAIRTGMRKSLKPVLAALRSKVPKVTGTLAKNIKIKTVRSRRGIKLTVGFGDKSWKPGKYYGTFAVLPTKHNKIVKGQTVFDEVFRAQGEAAKSQAEQFILTEIETLIESGKAQG